MNGKSSDAEKKACPSDFRISGGPVVSKRQQPTSLDLAQLPTSYGEPILFAIPRDPHTIFTYWNIDWSQAFARTAPVDRQVYLRLKRDSGSDELEEPVEPMLGSHFLSAAEPKGTYEVELGFYAPEDVWNSIAISDLVTMPAHTSSESSEIDIATVPFHLSFQRMIDLFRASNGDAIASLLARLQERAETPARSESLTNEEREILCAMDLSLSDIQEARRAFIGKSVDELRRKRAEAVLGFGGSSPTGGFGGASWISGGS